MALKIMMFSDFVCPFCYIGFEIMRRLRPEFGFELQWRGFQIHPEWPAEGMPVERFYQGAGDDLRRAVWERIRSLADPVGLPIKPPAVLTNSRLALEAAEFAHEAGKAEEFEELVYRAYFQEGANIGNPGIIAALAKQAGIDHGAMVEALKSPKYSMRLKNNALVANQNGVSGVPTFIIGDFPLVGAQSPEVMRQFLRRAAQRLGS